MIKPTGPNDSKSHIDSQALEDLRKVSGVWFIIGKKA